MMHALGATTLCVGLCLTPPRCSGTAQIRTDPVTGRVTAEVKWHKDMATGEVTTEIPPGAVAQVIRVGRCTITLPANPSEKPVPFSAKCKDPLILQLPPGWRVVSATVTTPLGTGPVVLTAGALPADGIISPYGSVHATTFYAPEPRHTLVMGDYPPGLAAPGPTHGTVVIEIPRSARSVAPLVFVSAAELTLHGTNGPVTWYPPVDPHETDFALVTGESHRYVIDAVSGTSCSAPAMSPSVPDWKIGGLTRLSAQQAAPGPIHFVGSLRELAQPFALGPPGCKLRIDPWIGPLLVLSTVAGPNGHASAPLVVPPSPALVGLTTAWQPLQLSDAGLVLGSHLKAKVEH